MGSGGLEERLVARAQLPLAASHVVPGGPLAGVSWRRRLVSALRLGVGLFRALWLIMRLRPRALLLTGGWSGLPVALAAWLTRVPTLIFLPDIEPGATIRFPAALRQSGRAHRAGVGALVPEHADGRDRLSAAPGVHDGHARCRSGAFWSGPALSDPAGFGGSRGARSINRALLTVLPALLEDGVQVLHVSGETDWPEVKARRASLPAEARYQVYPYLHHEMGLAQAAADLALSRAGASVLGEFPHAGLPALLVPYPWAWRYQKTNADWLVARGAALHVNDADMESDLLPTLRDLLADPERLGRMRRAALALAQADGAQGLAEQLLQLGGNRD